MVVSVEYNLIGRGWADCIFEIDDQQIHLIASYLSNSLADLLDAVTTMLRGADKGTVSFIEEPGEHRLQFKRVSKDRILICIFWSDEIWNNRSDEEGKEIFTVQCRLRTFAGAVLSASQKVLSKHGLDGYREQWVAHKFPLKLQAKLQEVLKLSRTPIQ